MFYRRLRAGYTRLPLEDRASTRLTELGTNIRHGPNNGRWFHFHDVSRHGCKLCISSPLDFFAPSKMRTFSGAILPFKTPDLVPESSILISVLLVACSMITSTTVGYDASMINGLNILPSYNMYFDLTTVNLALNTASVWIGGILAGLSFGKVTDIIGRRPSLFWAAVITLFAVILQTAAQNVGMFVTARILIGYGTSASALTGPTYLAETLPTKWRGWGLGIFNDFYYVGGLLAAGVTYSTSFWSSTWAWRLPSAIQGVFSIMCILILPFVPESPRWLAFQGRPEDALRVGALMHANGDVNNLVVLAQHKEITDTIEYEKNVAEPLSLIQMIKTPSARKRLILCTSVAVFSNIAGNVIVSYYLGIMLDNAGIKNTTTQLQINVVLNAFCLICALVGTYYIDRLGRKPTALISMTSPHSLPIHGRGTHEIVWHEFNEHFRDLCHGRHDLPFPRSLLIRMDASPICVPS
ncbi:Hexose transporter protein [Mycena sanguinolenta]|uniref:Hexose transporter protein n=1 Tax=Mycena sanguinolenta TaxID=230812 RepID=A0A8H6XWD9_9AGAR|nr:Hexose transporter protein [Mycena sanguinolenta]